MIAAAFFWVSLNVGLASPARGLMPVPVLMPMAAPPDTPGERVGDCASDPATLSARAEELLAAAGPEPVDAQALRRARELLRAARRSTPTVPLLLRAADLATVAGDLEEGGDLLAAAAEKRPASLSIPELLWVARRAEERRRWREALARYQELARQLEASEAGSGEWVAAHLRQLELEAQADAIAPPSAGPSVEARLALADGKRALAAGRLSEARSRLALALDLSPDYTEALLALGAVETRAGRSSAAIRAYRGALAAEPDNVDVEALTALANLLWEEPDRRAKEESLRLLDRACGLRPDLRGLLRLSASRWADFGDAPRALERLERFLARATPEERAQAQTLRDALSRRVRGAAEEPAPAATFEAAADVPASAAIDLWRKAQVYLERGGPDADAQALASLAQAEQADPSLARAPELAASIHVRRGEWPEAEEALRRAIRADPSRAADFENLARLLEREPGRAGEALAVWKQALAAGSTEALFPLARAAESEGSQTDALVLYRRYRSEAPAGPRAEEAATAVARLEARRRIQTAAWVSLIAVALAAFAWTLARRRSGSTLAEWLAKHPGKAQEVRPVVGRLRHEVLKHGGMVLADCAERLKHDDSGARREVAELLVTRLYSSGADAKSRGLLAEADSALSQLRVLARGDGVRLNLRHRDPVFRWLTRGLDALRQARGSLERIARGASASGAESEAARAAALLNRASRSFTLCSGAEIDRTVERVAVLHVRVDALRALLSRVAAEMDMPAQAPELETLGTLTSETSLPGVRIPALDWETIWRNLFANALEEARRRGRESVRLGLAVERRRDPVTGEARLRLVLADDLPEPLDPSLLRGRAAERGWGVVAELLRRCGGSLDVGPPPVRGFAKGIEVELPAADDGCP